MYEQPKTSAAGRFVWFIISLLIIGGIVWLILWFFFWREPSVKTDTSDTSNTSSEQSDTNSSTSKSKETSESSSSASTSTGSNSSGSDSSSTSSTSSTPSSLGQVAEETTSTTTLANTGPGDIVTPVAIAVVGGMLFYQIRLRRRFVPDAE